MDRLAQAPGPRRAEAAAPPADSLGRPLRELRLSVTDRCNLRCTYCMPREMFQGHAFAPRAELLTFEELARLAGVFRDLGVRKVRLTGGEPLLRSGLPELVRHLRPLGQELALTTNGLLLPRLARPLAEAGLDRVTVSLDGLDDAAFARMVDAPFRPADVLAGIEAAAAAGLGPVKVNCVVRRGMNEDQVIPLAERFRGSGIVIRFIEYMDVGQTNGWSRREVVTAEELLAALSAVWPLDPVEAARPGEPALRYRYRDGAGEVGIVASVTRPFCRGCARARLSAVGDLHSCLFAGPSLSLKAPLRAGASDEALARLLAERWRARDDRYSELRGNPLVELRARPEMSALGG